MINIATASVVTVTETNLTLRVTGTTTPNTGVLVFFNDSLAPTGTTISDGEGNWTATLSVARPSGTHWPVKAIVATMPGKGDTADVALP